jgi:hypothetical protein
MEITFTEKRGSFTRLRAEGTKAELQKLCSQYPKAVVKWLEPTFNFFTNKLATEARVEITQNS